jgi:transposase
MGAPYSDDLRRKLLEAHQRGEGPLDKLAIRFSVSEAWAKKISAQLSRTGKMEREPAGKRGPTSKITPAIEQDLKNWIAKQADLTLVELQARLLDESKVKISISRLWTVLKQIGLRLKKSRSTPQNKTPKSASERGSIGVTKRKASRQRN